MGRGQGRVGRAAEGRRKVSPGHSEGVPAVTAATREENVSEATETAHQPSHPSSTRVSREGPSSGGKEASSAPARPPALPVEASTWDSSVRLKCHQRHCVSEGLDPKLRNRRTEQYPPSFPGGNLRAGFPCTRGTWRDSERFSVWQSGHMQPKRPARRQEPLHERDKTSLRKPRAEAARNQERRPLRTIPGNEGKKQTF